MTMLNNPAARTFLRSAQYLTQRRLWSSYTTSDTALTIHSLGNRSFPYVWLRDSCQSSPECIHPTTSQKLHKTSDIPIDIKPVENGISVDKDGIRIKWSDGHESSFLKSFLRRHSSPEDLFSFHKDVSQIPWTNASITSAPNLYVTYEALKTPEGRAPAIAQLAKYGLVFVQGVPNKETDDRTCELRKLAGIFGPVRPTFYGETWDVRNVRNSRNVAYTNLDLGLHMDLLYFEHPPRYQILHCLRNRVRGGTSIFVDAANAATVLRTQNPAFFDTLCKTPVAYHYINDGHHLHHDHPVIEVHGGEIKYINYSPPFQAPLPVSTPLEFYPALKEFTNLLNSPGNTYEYTLKEGDAVMFDNRRVLHARTAFYDLDSDGKKDGDALEGETARWLKGCYLEADAVMDQFRMLKTKPEKLED